MDDLTVDQITKAMRAYLGTYALPKLPKADNQHLLNGFLNDVGLPSDGNDFCVFTPITTERNGGRGSKAKCLLHHSCTG